MSDAAPTDPAMENDPTPTRDVGQTRRARMRRLLLAAIGVLYMISVPWYRDTEAPLRIWFGLPDWVAVALGCYVGVAVLNAMAWRLTEVPETVVANAVPDGSES